MATIHMYDPRVNITYVYESKGYYDREAHKTKFRRKLIGKLDENGNVVPTGKRGRPPKNIQADSHVEGGEESTGIDYKSLYESYAKDSRLKEERIQALQTEIDLERKARKECERALRRMMDIGNAYTPVSA